MELTRKEFILLTALAEAKDTMSQRELAASGGMSIGSVNRLLRDLSERGYVKAGRLTPDGLLALEPYRVKRAVFMAAGFGARMVPITLNTPKPLIRVRGQRIIDTLLDAVLAAGIEEIYIVRGYLAEEFDQLLYKYPMIHFIENPVYNESNNISSMFCACGHLQNAYVLEGDLLLYHPGLITKYQYESNYLAVPVERTDDWCFRVENDIIKEVMVGGTNCYHMFGISYWTAEDGAKLVDHIKQVYQAPGGKERLFEHVPLTYYKDQYSVHIRPCSFEDLVEIDTFNELKTLDASYGV